MATHSSVLAWRIPGTGGAWWAAAYGVAQSWTRLNRLGSSSTETQMVKNLPAMWETWVQSLGWEDPLEEGMATHSSILAWENPHGQRSLVGCCLWGCAESDTTEAT